MNPVILEMLLKAYYLSKGLPEDAGTQSQAHDEGVHWLFVNELIKQDALIEGYHVTTRGSFFVKMMLDTPLPEKQWVDPR